MLTTPDAQIGVTPRDVVWTHRKTTLYRYRSAEREHAVPVLLVFALINRPRSSTCARATRSSSTCSSEGFDVFLVDWGVPDEEDADMGLERVRLRRAPLGGARDAARRAARTS